MADHDQLKQNTQSSRADESGRMMVDKKPPTVAVCGPTLPASYSSMTVETAIRTWTARNSMHVQIHTLQFNHSQKEMLEPC